MSTSPNEIVFNLTIDTQDIRARYRSDYISGNELYAVLNS
jgi:hypothetical protein